MRVSIVTILAIVIAHVSCFAKEIRLKGYIGIEGGESFNYEIVFTDSAGILNGYSLTYEDEKKETKSAISGYIDKSNRIITFKELNIIYNHGFHSNNTMCLIDATVKYTANSTQTGYIMKGTYKSADASTTYCGMGTVTFVNDDVFKTLFEAIPPRDTAATVKKKTPETPKKPAGIRVVEVTYPANARPAPVPAPKTTDEITAGVEKIYEWKSDTVVVDVWDGGNIDGDRITLLYNGKKVLNNYLLAREKKQLRFPVSATGIDVITIIANNEGSEPPNTANLQLTDDTTTYDIIAYNDTGNEAHIKIKKRTAQ